MGERVEEALVVTGRQPTDVDRIAGAAFDQLRMTARCRYSQAIGVRPGPVERGLFAIYAERKAAGVPDGDLARPERPAHTAFETQIELCIVFDAPARDEGGKIGRERLASQAAGDEFGEMEPVRADIGETSGTGSHRIGAPLPLCLLAARLLDQTGEPLLRRFRGMMRSFPSRPPATRRRASRTELNRAVRLVRNAAASISMASASVIVSGLSQWTGTPASRKARTAP